MTKRVFPYLLLLIVINLIGNIHMINAAGDEQKYNAFITIEDNMTSKVQQNFYLAISILVGVIVSGVIDVCVACFS